MFGQGEYQCFNCFQVNFYKFNKVENGLFSLFGGDLNFLNRVLLSSLYKGNNQIPVFFSEVFSYGWLESLSCC